MAVEGRDVAPLALAQWEALPWLGRGIAFDEARIDEPGALLADENEDAHLDARVGPALTAATCRRWSQVQALAVIDCCLRSDLDPLPTSADTSATADSD
ncbi:hypothetical protein NQK81_02535 [Amycolatopsis roodepoortensis]|uniref:hypothetical protein n=1 Tax=Amycolatopsis roodepoortensis TaxID=700274 RepID=UPI00214B572F|nr:hypothetical protein [Amycolatopsis roodepoortensis]UUV32351.1 hypothetical protein NQK81_02535 [Amycolatopsis roodepoortensis]